MVFQQAFVTICLGHDSLQNVKVDVKLSLMILKFCYNFLLDEGQSQVQTSFKKRILIPSNLVQRIQLYPRFIKI